MGSLDESMKGLALSPESNPLVGIKLYSERQHIYYTEGGGGGVRVSYSFYNSVHKISKW